MRVYLQKFDNQEVQARCCAMFSRSHKSLDVQATQATAEQAEAFARTYVVGYGHNSINDCGSVCAAVERVSMLAAKFIEDYPLFNGQESSTRYIPFDIAEFEDIVESPYTADDPRIQLQRDLMAFYRDAKPVQQTFIASENGIDDLDSEPQDTQRAIRAKSFDILRGFLPAGCRTQVAWVTTFRQAVERIEMMMHHPLREVREIGQRLRESCIGMYPGAFAGLEKRSHAESAEEWYNREFWEEYHTPMMTIPFSVRVPDSGFESERYPGRPASKRVPARADLRSEEIEIVAKIDYGSWRDIHRHRNCTQAFPLLTAEEFEPFYLENLAPELKARAVELVNRTKKTCSWRRVLLKSLTLDKYLNQYAIPMGFMVTYWAKWSISQAAYVLELRSKPTVHPTVRRLVKRIADIVLATDGCPDINCDWSGFPYTRKVDMRRGKET